MDREFTNTKLKKFKEDIVRKKIAIVGLGISNLPLALYLSRLGCNITIFDEQPPEKLKSNLDALAPFDIEYHLGKDYLSHLKGFDIIFKTPKIRHDTPELIAEASSGADVTSEMEVFLDLCPCRTCGITGSVGKTTTTSIIDAILRNQGYNCWLGGNIGVPLLEKIDRITPDDMVILELSSFQLQTMHNSPNISVLTNISPNHLDVHKSYEEYIDAKKHIYKYHGSNDRLVLNYDDSILRAISSEYQGRITWFSRHEQPVPGVYVHGAGIIYNDGKHERAIMSVNNIILPGMHILENYLAAIAAVIGDVDASAVRKTAAEFKGVEHRMELFAEYNGVKFYNDSKATSPISTIAGLRAFEGKIILIAGGRDKHLDYSRIGYVIHEKVKYLLLSGETSDAIEASYRQALNDMKLAENSKISKSTESDIIPVHRCADYHEAVKKAYKASVSGDVILFSPASTSFDKFINFEERGNVYKETVKQFISEESENK